MGFFSSISHAFEKATNALGGFFSGAASTISKDAHSAASTIKSATSTLYTDVKNGVSTVYKTSTGFANTALSDVKSTLDNTINKTTGILSMPLILIGAAVVLFAYNSRSSFQASYNK
jgi:phage-related protein